ncbi:MAG: TolC family protein, partial [Leptospiraceae bacterium]|nr:TolC family protein [Leptospiraceae bacterium]
LNSVIEKPVPIAGLSFFAGYKRGIGEFPVYKGGYFTKPRGQVRAGAKIPLWAGREIDENRLELKKAGIGRGLGVLQYEKTKLYVFQKASETYWQWVAAGMQYEIVENLYQLAEKRMKQLNYKITLGDTAKADGIENNRMLLERKAMLIEAERYLQKTSIKLSLFYRDKTGEPILLTQDSVPKQLPKPHYISNEDKKKDLELAWSRRPELMIIQIERKKKSLDIDLYKNQVKPQIDLIISAAKQVPGGGELINEKNKTGTIALPPLLKPEKFEKTDVEASFVISVPLQTRKQRGKIESSRAKLSQIQQKQKLIRDKIRAELQDAASLLEMAGKEVDITKKESEMAEKLEVLEKEKYELGDSNLFMLNQREQKTAMARIKYIKSLSGHHIAHAIYRSATGEWNERYRKEM